MVLISLVTVYCCIKYLNRSHVFECNVMHWLCLVCSGQDTAAKVMSVNYCELQMITVVAQVEKLMADTDTADVTENLASCIISPETSESTSAVNENTDINLSELVQDLPKLPPKLSQVPPRPASNRSRITCSQSFTAAPPRPPPMQPRFVHRTHSSATSGLPPVPPRAPRAAVTVANDQSTLSSLQQPATASSNAIMPHPVSLFSNASSDAGTSGTTFNYVYFTEDAVPPTVPMPVTTKSRKHKQPPDLSLLQSRHATHASIGKKLADSGFGTVTMPGSDPYDSNPSGSYVRLAVTSSPRAIDHDYCYPSIDAVMPSPTVSVCHIEPHHSPPPLPTKSRHVGWWDCHRRRRRPRSSQFRATWTQRSATYGTELSVDASHRSLNNSQSSSLNTRRPPAAWHSRFLCFVRTCIHPCRWRRRCRQIRRLGPSRGHESVMGHL